MLGRLSYLTFALFSNLTKWSEISNEGVLEEGLDSDSWIKIFLNADS